MRTPRALVVLATATVAAALAIACRPAHAAAPGHPPTTRDTTTLLWTVAIDETCKAVHSVDRLANAGFCRAHLVTRPNARAAAAGGTSALAELAAAAGASHASDAAREIWRALRLLRRDGGDEGRAATGPGAVWRRALERCGTLYGAVRARYEAARDAVAEGRYGDVATELGGVPAIAQLCEAGFLGPGSSSRPPHWLEDYEVFNTQFAHLAVAITSLIKDKE
ncbi:hypothetical protein BRADI_1g76393v3 [Brachypodium distachyon]|uniref:Pectinesterase inhibitor domain-containing protein n=1 Tax=Brachypodium distachyon TaxID=15368 RepID=A0A0Q3HMD2_BRADI|nr:hypothetical protein BRADI_1g76393v3 [Brachypodium distachyon]